MKVSSLLPVAVLLATVTSEPIPAKRDRPADGPGRVVRRPPPWAGQGYGTGGWGRGPSTQLPGSVISSGTASIGASFSDRPRNGTTSSSSTEVSPVTASGSTSTALVTQTVTSNVTDPGPSVSILPITDSVPTGIFPPYGYFPVPSGAVSSSTEVSPVTGSDSSFPAFPTPCNETTAPNTAPTAPLSTGATTITIPLTLTSTLSATTITISPSGGSSVSPLTGSNVTSSSGTAPPYSAPSVPRTGNGTSSAPGTGTSASPISPITVTDGSSGFPVGTGRPTGMPSGRPTGYWPMPPRPYPPFPISSRPRSGYQTMSGTGAAPGSSPIAPVTGSNSTSSIAGPTGVSSSTAVVGNITTISTETAYTTLTIPTPPVVGPSSTEGSAAGSSSNSTILSPTGPSTTITTQSTSTGTTTFTVPGITTRTVVETFTLNTTLTITVTGTGTGSMPYPPFTPTGAVSSSVADAGSGTQTDFPSTSAFTTITITPRTTLSSATATNTPYTPTTASRLPGGYERPPPYGEVYEPEAQGWFGSWGRVVGNWRRE